MSLQPFTRRQRRVCVRVRACVCVCTSERRRGGEGAVARAPFISLLTEPGWPQPRTIFWITVWPHIMWFQGEYLWRNLRYLLCIIKIKGCWKSKAKLQWFASWHFLWFSAWRTTFSLAKIMISLNINPPRNRDNKTDPPVSLKFSAPQRLGVAAETERRISRTYFNLFKIDCTRF